MASYLGLPVTQFKEDYWKSRLAYDEAALDAASYWERVAQRRLTSADIDHLNEIDAKSWTHADPVMPAWARLVRNAGLRTALLSNMPIPVRDYVERCDWLPEFDQRIYSCDLRVGKPSRLVYERCLGGLRVDPAEALFLDDRTENVQAAEAVGMHGIVFSTPIALVTELHRRFAIPGPLIAKVISGDEEDQ